MSMFFSIFKNDQEKIFEAHKNLMNFTKAKNQKMKSGNIRKYELKALEEKEKELYAKKYKYESQFMLKNNYLGLYMGIGVDLGNLEVSPIILPWADISNHTVVYGTTRVGKTKLMLNNVRQHIIKGDDVTIFDPKGGIKQEVFNKVIEFADESNRLEDIVFVNPLMPSACEYFNPIWGLGDDEIASLIASTLFPNPIGDSQFYSGHTSITLKAILYSLSFLEKCSDKDGTFVIEKEKQEYLKYLKIKKFKNNQINFFDKQTGFIDPDIADRVFSEVKEEITTEKMILNRSFITFKDIFHYIKIDRIESLKNTVEKMSFDDDKERYNELYRMKQEALSLLEEVLSKPKEFHTKVVTSLSNFLSDISTGALGLVFCSVRINPILTRLCNPDKKLILILQPVPLKIKKVSEFVNKIFIKMFESVYGIVSVSGRALSNRRHWLHLDEGESALYPGVESLLNKAAGLGLTLYIYTQSLADLRAKLGEVLSQISQDSLNTYIVMRLNDPTSAGEVIKVFGDQTFTETSIVSGEGGSRISFSSTTKDLLTRESIIRLRVGEGFLKNKSNTYRVIFPVVPDREEQYIIEAEILSEEVAFKRVVALEESLKTGDDSFEQISNRGLNV